MDPVLADFLVLARRLRQAKLYYKSFEVFVATLTRDPLLADGMQSEIRDLLGKLNNDLAQQGGIKDIFANFESAMKIYPNSHHLFNDLGMYLYKYSFYKAAICHFEKALHLSPHHVTSEKHLNTVKNYLVDRWHYRMLNDSRRNAIYRLSIQMQVLPEDKVLDVGTGTGLLAIYAWEAGATDIIACDNSETMIELANTILESNQFPNEGIKVLNKLSTSMTSQDMDGKATLLLTEMFDAGLFGENVLQMLYHAWTHLLSKQARVIPYSAEFFVIGAQCNYLNMKYQLGHDAKKLLNLGERNIHVLDEPYDCEDIHKQKDIKYLTQSQSVINVNFNSLINIETNLKRTKPYNVELKATQDGVVNTIIGWFNVYFSDTILLTTDPRSDDRASAWQQALFYDEVPRNVKEGNSFNLQFLLNGGCLELKPSSSKITRASSEVIRFLNDEIYMNAITNCIPTASIYLNRIVDMPQTKIADFCPFPLFGLFMMKHGAASLLCCAKNKHDKKFFIEVFKKNNIPLNNITILLGTEWTIKDINDKYHAIFAHFLELGGDVDIRLKDIAVNLKAQHLHNDGLFMPANLWLVGQLVNCDWLETNNYVFDENVSRFKIADYVNKYSVSMNYFIDFSTLEYKPITDPVRICIYSYGQEIEFTSTYAINDGHPNTILCSYMIELMPDSELVTTTRPNSFIDGMVNMIVSDEIITGSEIRFVQVRDEEGAYRIFIQ